MTYYSDMINKYLKDHNISRDMFSCICRISLGIVNLIMKGRTPGPTVSRKIFIATKGELNLNIPYRTKRLKLNGSKKIHSKSAVVSNKRQELILP